MNPVDLIAESLADDDGQPERKGHEHYQSRARGVLYMLAAAGFQVRHHSETRDAVEPLTLKTEDGRFVKVKPSTLDQTGTLYRIVEDPE
jgi:hypothetical protein